MNNIKQVIADKGLRKNWIAGRRIPSSPKKRILCKLLGCKVIDLFPKKEKNG